MAEQIKILIIDDEEDFCFFVRKNLENTGEFKVFIATTGDDGISLAKVEKPDLILLDVMMPQVAGPDVVELLKSDPKTSHTPVLFLTAIVTKEEIGVEPVRNIGGHDYIAKPVELEKLVGSIKRKLAEESPAR